MAIDTGRYGIWLPADKLNAEIAADIERLGYTAIWIGTSPPGDLLLAEQLLDGTEHIVIATGIVNMWKDDADTVARSYHRIAARHPDRFLLGVGIGHPEATQEYRRPYDTIVSYLDRLDEGGVPVDRRVLAALGPKVLRLARDRTAGAHPYLTTPGHTKLAREILGDGPLLAPEQKVVLDTDADRAREIGRARVRRPYLALSNYIGNLKRLGWTDEDVADPGSDRLIDALALHGTAATVADGVKAHLDAGADHVAIQALTGDDDPLSAYRELATALF